MITLTRVASRDGYVDPEAIKQAITPRTSLVAMTHASNVLGTVQPIEAIAAIVREAGALFLVDAAQSAGVVPIDLRATPIDLLAFPGHKALYGPTGTGALYAGPRTDGKLRPWREGGTGGDSSSATQPTHLPYFLEGGTPNVLGVAGLAAGIAWVAERGPDSLRRHEVELLQQVVDWAEDSDGWHVAGRWDPTTHVGALSLVVRRAPRAPGPRRDPRHQLRHRRPARSALCALHPPRPRHVPRRNAPPEPGPVHHERRHRRLSQRAYRDHRGGRLSRCKQTRLILAALIAGNLAVLPYFVFLLATALAAIATGRRDAAAKIPVRGS